MCDKYPKYLFFIYYVTKESEETYESYGKDTGSEISYYYCFNTQILVLEYFKFNQYTSIPIHKQKF